MNSSDLIELQVRSFCVYSGEGEQTLSWTLVNWTHYQPFKDCHYIRQTVEAADSELHPKSTWIYLESYVGNFSF